MKRHDPDYCVACGEYMTEGPAMGRLCYPCIEQAVIKINEGEKKVKEKKFSFDYIGENKQGKHFCIITDDGEGNGIGISTCYHYYVLKADGSIKHNNYMSIPMFNKRPGAAEAAAVMDRVTRFFNGWIPYNMEIVNPEEAE